MLVSKGIILFTQLAGVFPAKCFISANGGLRFEPSSFLYKWSLLLVIFQTLWMFLAVESDIFAYLSRHSIAADTNLKAISIIIETFAQNILTIICLAIAYKRLNNLISIYIILQRCKHLESSKRTNQDLVTILVVVFLSCLILGSYRSFIVQYWTYAHLVYLPYLTQYFNMTAMCLQFYYVCITIIGNFQTINIKIQHAIDNMNLDPLPSQNKSNKGNKITILFG